MVRMSATITEAQGLNKSSGSDGRLRFKGKSFRQAVLSSFRTRFSSITCSMMNFLLLFVVLTVMVYSGHCLASHVVNTRDWVMAPINNIERVCLKPTYSILTDAPGKICLTTLTDAKKADTLQRLVRWRNFDSLLEMTLPNKKQYVQKHGYHLYDESNTLDNTRPPSWSKILAVQRLLTQENCDWVFWMDADTVVMNSSKRLEDFLPQDKDLLLTIQKGGSYNAGAWIIKNTPWSLQFLDTWWNMKEFVLPKGLSVSGDNDALKEYLLHRMPKDEFDQHIGVPPRCTFNSVTRFLTPEEASSMTEAEMKRQFWYQHHEFYHKGDLIAHVAGRNNKLATTAMLLRDAQ